MSSSDPEHDGDLDIFTEPEGFRQPEKQPTNVSHTTLREQVLNLRLIGYSPLWGHHLWNAGRILATYLEERATSLIKDKTVLELGAGAGLPSLLCAFHGAKTIVATDYPDADLIENLRGNLHQYAHLSKTPAVNVYAGGYIWGAPVDKLTRHLAIAPASHQNEDQEPGSSNEGFDLLILADLLFNHSEHGKLVFTIQQTLKRSPSAVALVFFTPYRPWLMEKDLAFFDLARKSGFVVEKVCEELMDQVMFEDDPGDEVLRRTVFGYAVRWPEARG